MLHHLSSDLNYFRRLEMITGNTHIKKCTGCSQCIRQDTYNSFNTFGARFWTDGKVEADNYPDLPELVECPHCGALLWINELKIVGEVRRKEYPKRIKGSAYYHEPTTKQYLQMLHRKKPLTREKVLYIRVRLWWAGNDKRRYYNSPEISHEGFEKESNQNNGRQQVINKPLTGGEISNLQSLADMLNERFFRDRLMKAEIMRELAQFEEASRLLKRKFNKDFSEKAVFIKELVQRKNQYVAAGWSWYALEHASEELRADRELVLKSVEIDGSDLKYASDVLRADKEVVLRAINSVGSALEYATENLRADRAFIMIAVEENGSALEYASDVLRADKGVVLRAINSDGCALEYANDVLRADREVVMMALKENGCALEYVSDDLRADRQVVFKAITSNESAFRYARVEEWRSDLIYFSEDMGDD
jgi:superoxide dismutase